MDGSEPIAANDQPVTQEQLDREGRCFREMLRRLRAGRPRDSRELMLERCEAERRQLDETIGRLRSAILKGAATP